MSKPDGRVFEAVHVPLGERSYNVLVGQRLIAECGRLMTETGKGPRAVAIVTDANVAAHHLAAVQRAIEAANIKVRGVVTVPPGEASKSFGSFETVAKELLGTGLERRDQVVALGGGVIGDLAGFAAAVLRRGVEFVQIPTSLLAQVDSSVGGKTGINTEHGKNLIGAFHQPRLVLADIDVLATLPDRELAAGYAEVAKYGLLGDAVFFDWLDQNRDRISGRDTAALTYAVKRSVEMKAEIVARDETETGDRALLNLGHTFGHALEAWAGYSDRLLHGEAVSIGMCLAFRLSEQLGKAPPQSAARVAGHLKSMGLPTNISDIPGGTAPTVDELVGLMAQDKKVVDGRLTLILVRNIGDAYITRDVGAPDVARFLDDQLGN